MRSEFQFWWTKTEQCYRVEFVFRRADGSSLGFDFHWTHKGDGFSLWRPIRVYFWGFLKFAATLLALWAALRTLGFV